MSETERGLESQLAAALGGSGLVSDQAEGGMEIFGRDALDLLHRISTNSLQHLKPGMSRDTIFTDAKGRLVSVATLAVSEDRIVLLCSARDEEKLMDWIAKYIITEDVQLKGLTPDVATIKLIGPDALAMASALIGREIAHESLVELKGNHGTIAAVVSGWRRCGLVTLLMHDGGGGDQREAVVGRLKSLGAVELGKEAWELYRISRGIPASGAEVRLQFTPYDVALADLVSYSKGCYIGQEVIARLETYQKARRSLFGIRCSERPAGLELPVALHSGGVQAGVCTSLSASPIHGEHLGLAVLQRDAASEGACLSMAVSDRLFPCRVAAIPMEFGSG